MGCQKIINQLDTTSDNVTKFFTKKWIEVHHQSRKIYNTNKEIRIKTSMLQSDLCDYSDAYIVVEGTITVTYPSAADQIVAVYDKNLAFKNNAPFISCISKINNTLNDNAVDLDFVMSMYNLIKYSKN